jgi:hypothetical protein
MTMASLVGIAQTAIAALPRPAQALLAFAIAAQPAWAGTEVFTPCHGSDWQITGESPEDHDLICDTVQAAIAFLGSCSLEPPRPTRVRVIDDLPLFCDQPAYGVYDSASDEITIASPRACFAATRPDDLFAKLRKRDAFVSVVAHETAHVALHASGLTTSSWLEHEYIASITQLAVLDRAVREGLLADLGVQRPVRPTEINSIILGFSPLVFAARAWLEFEAKPDGCAHLLGLARGTERLPRLPGD